MRDYTYITKERLYKWIIHKNLKNNLNFKDIIIDYDINIYECWLSDITLFVRTIISVDMMNCYFWSKSNNHITQLIDVKELTEDDLEYLFGNWDDNTEGDLILKNV